MLVCLQLWLPGVAASESSHGQTDSYSSESFDTECGSFASVPAECGLEQIQKCIVATIIRLFSFGEWQYFIGESHFLSIFIWGFTLPLYSSS